MHVDIRHLEGLAVSFFLDIVGKTECVLVVVLLEEVEAAAKDDLPASVGGYVSVVDGVTRVVLVGKVDTRAFKVFLQSGQKRLLVAGSRFIHLRDELYINLVSYRLDFQNHLDEFAQVLGLMEVPDIGVLHGDRRGSLKVVGKELFEADPFLVLRHLDVLAGFQCGLACFPLRNLLVLARSFLRYLSIFPEKLWVLFFLKGFDEIFLSRLLVGEAEGDGDIGLVHPQKLAFDSLPPFH